MTQHNAIKLFETQKVRTIWDDKEEKWYFSIVDVVSILTDSIDATAYWRKLKQRLKAEGNETVTACHGLKMLAADGKMRLTDVADTQQLLRLIQSIPSPKAEPFKLWMAQVAAERLDQMQDPELSINQALTDYKRLGYSDNWINQRLKSIEIRKDLTDEWKRHGLQEGMQFATLTDIIYQTWSDMTAKEYKQFKGLKKENLRDNMTNKELILNMLAELSTKEISESKAPETFQEHINIAEAGGEIARNARLELEAKTGKAVISPLNAKTGIALNSFPNKKEDIKNIKKLVIFDLDGTLLNTIADLAQSTNHALAALGYPTHEEEAYNFMVGNGINKLFERALPAADRTEENVLRVRKEFIPYYDRHNADKSRPYPGIPELLNELQAQGVQLAVASNKYQSATEKLIAHYFPDIRFIAVFGQREGVNVKPDPTVVHDILEIAHIDKEDVLYVGDSGVDMQTAINASVTACGVTWGFRPRTELEAFHPAHIVDHAKEIAAIALK